MTTALTDQTPSYAAEVARLLWPAPWEAPSVTRSGRVHGLPHRDAYLFPSERRARLIVPADVPGSSTMLRRLGRGPISLTGPLGRLVERSVSSSAFALTRWPMLCIPATDPQADSIETHLADCLGVEVRVGVLLGTRRANQKPVLQVFDRRGGLLAYAKVGHNELTAGLVRSEAQALATIARCSPRSFEVPQVLQHGQWSGLEVLVLSPLTTDRRQGVPGAARLAAMREVAHLTGTAESSLAASGFWARLCAWTEQLTPGPFGDRLGSATVAVEQGLGAEVVTLGARHGDWGFWNMGMGEGGLKVWDWERFDVEAPIGFDAVHYAAQKVQPGRRDARRQERVLLRALPDLLGPLGVDRSRHDLTLLLYLLEIALRYADALSHGPLPALERRTEWVLSLLEHLLGDPQRAPSRGRP